MLELCQHTVKEIQGHEVFIRYLHISNFMLFIIDFLTSLRAKHVSVAFQIFASTQVLHYALRHLCVNFLFHFLFKVRILHLEQNFQNYVVVFLAILHFQNQVRDAEKIKIYLVDNAVNSNLRNKSLEHSIVFFVAPFKLVCDCVELSYLQNGEIFRHLAQKIVEYLFFFLESMKVFLKIVKNVHALVYELTINRKSFGFL